MNRSPGTTTAAFVVRGMPTQSVKSNFHEVYEVIIKHKNRVMAKSIFDLQQATVVPEIIRTVNADRKESA
jgi:hypothetical protein